MTAEADDEPTVPIVCPECDTTTQVRLPAVRETLDRHNDRLHDGEAVAEVDPELVDELADVVAADMGLL